MKPTPILISGAALAFVVALVACSPDPMSGPPADEALRSMEQEFALKNRLPEGGLSLPPSLFCAAQYAEDSSVRTLYMIYIYKRAEEVGEQEIHRASIDVVTRIEECGGDLKALTHDLKTRGQIIPQAVVVAMIQEGRTGVF